jgi:SAM-dependent methyltransferase
MKPDEVRQLYDTAYSRTYEEKFLLSPINAKAAELELEHLRSLITAETAAWLDVACGTGYFLRQFPSVNRIGIDISPAMLDRARESNPNVEFFEHDFRHGKTEWSDRFSLVSCMWYAYTLVDTIGEVSQVIENLAAWTAQDGICYVPLADPRLIARCDLPYHIDDNWEGQTTVTGILWGYSEYNGEKVHSHLVAPQTEFMVEQFSRHFEIVEIVRHYCDGIAHGSPVLVASKKR